MIQSAFLWCVNQSVDAGPTALSASVLLLTHSVWRLAALVKSIYVIVGLSEGSGGKGRRPQRAVFSVGCSRACAGEVPTGHLDICFP